MDSHRVAVVVVYQAIDRAAVLETAGEGVEGAVLLDQDDDVLDLALPVSATDLDGLGDGQREAGQGDKRHNPRGNHLDLELDLDRVWDVTAVRAEERREAGKAIAKCYIAVPKVLSYVGKIRHTGAEAVKPSAALSMPSTVPGRSRAELLRS